MKRFTATEKWEDPWFRKLSPEHKCFWEFLCDRCDAAGVWKVDLETAEHFIGAKINEPDLLRSFGDRIEVLPNGRWWIKKFIEFQYGSLSKECKPHIPVIRLLGRHGLKFETLMKGYAKGIDTLEEKETYKEKDKKGSAEGGNSGNPTLPEVQTEASMRGITPGCAESFWNKHEGRGWVDGQGQPIRDWRPLLRNWATTWRANDSKANGRPGTNGTPNWRRREELVEQIRRLGDEFQATRDEGRRTAIREERKMLEAERDSLAAVNGGGK